MVVYICCFQIEKVTMARKALPQSVRQLVLLEAGYKCANPVCRSVLTLEIHHIVWVKDDGSNKPENLLALCANCHALHTKGHTPDSAIRTWKAMLIALNTVYHGAADLLLVLAEEERRICAENNATNKAPRFRFSGDGLPALAGLISSGLVVISARYSGAGSWGGGTPSFEVKLTEKGNALVAAWSIGSNVDLQEAISGSE